MKEFSPIRYSLCVQALVCVSCSILALLLGQGQAWSFILSFLAGAMIFIVPNLYFTYYAFRFKFRNGRADFSEWIRRSFMWGQMGKLALAAVGFALVFRFVKPLNVNALFAGYIVMIFTQWWLGRKIATVAAAGATTEPKDGSE